MDVNNIRLPRPSLIEYRRKVALITKINERWNACDG